MKRNQPAIFPIYLSESEAYRLVKEHFWQKFENEKRRLWGESILSYSATLREGGEVEVFVHFSADDGFMMSAGPLLRETCRPYNDEKLENLVLRKKMELATEEYNRRRDEKELKAIMKVFGEMFPTNNSRRSTVESMQVSEA